MKLVFVSYGSVVVCFLFLLGLQSSVIVCYCDSLMKLGRTKNKKLFMAMAGGMI